MNPRARIASLLLAVTLLVAAGCAASPTAKWAQARETLTTAQDVMLAQHQAGRINDVTFVRLNEYVQPARAALNQAAVYLPEGGKSFQDRLAVVMAFVKQMEPDKQP